MRTFAVFALLLLASTIGHAASDVVVPEPLKAWVPWALYDDAERGCPTVGAEQHRCRWPGALDLAVTAGGGSFSQRFTVMKQEHVALPGGDERWPQDVTVDGKKAVVVDSNGQPTITLPTGEHLVRGVFVWDEQPESLAVPAETPVVTLSVGGRAVLFPRRTGASISFDKDDGAEKERDEDSVEVAIFRKVIDDAPLLIETRLVIDVAGKAREITVDNALLPGFQTASVSGPMPVRVEGTSLRAQVRPGTHTVVVIGRSADKAIVMKGPAASAANQDAPAEEIWVYEARPSLRVAHVDAVAIAADQTRLPAEWRTLPAYRVLPGEAFTLVEDRRGDADAPPSELSIYRTLWLDFDGNGATVRDQLSGSFTGDRLEMAEGTSLGHVAVGGRDAFITSLSTTSRPGVEVRQRNLNVVAESRIEHGLASFPAVGWAHDFQGASIDLQLPPGFSLVSAAGVDTVSDTWVQRWTLFEIFLVVVLVVAIGRLWGALLSVVAAFAFVLTFQESGAPIASWCFVVVLAALHRALPERAQHHWAVRALAYLRLFVAAIVVLITASFAVDQVRIGMYPTLAQQWRRVGDGGDGQRFNDGSDFAFGADFAPPKAMAMAPPPPPASPATTAEAAPLEQQQEDNDDGAKRDRRQAKDEPRGGAFDAINQLASSNLSDPESYGRGSGKKMKPKRKMTTVDPDAVVQTGPGLPRWAWSTVTLSFSGPVQADQQIQLWLVTPKLNLLLALVRVALLAVLLACAFGLPGGRWPRALLRRFRGRGAVWLTTVVVLASSSLSSSAQAQAVPSPEVLEQLRERLLAPPWCGADCVQISRVRAEASSSSLRLVFEVHADADFAVPVPANDDQWTPRSILVDGKPANAVREADHLLVRVSEGVHDVVLEGPLPARDSVALTLPMVPRQGVFSSTSWLLDGLHEDGVVDANLQLTRIEKAAGTSTDKSRELPPSVLAPFLLIERTVMIGLVFEVETRVVRLSPLGASVVVDVPLLAGENVTTDGVRTEQKDGKGVVKVSLGPADSETSWRSTLAQASTITLTAPSAVPWLESWQVQESPLWHVTRTGIPTVHGSTAAEGTAAFRPWPGERVELQLTRPAGVAGQTVTIDEAKLLVSPGLRSTDAVLILELRASRGGQHTITLPVGTELLSSTVNNAPAPLRPNNNAVVVPLSPGSQRIELHLRMPSGVDFATHTPTVDIGKDAVNVELTLELPQDRWVLFVNGPRTGPAVLFWSFLLVIVAAAACLSRVPVSPLKLHQWVLLSLGLTQVPVPVAALVAGWLLVLGWRERPRWSTPGTSHDLAFALFQLTLVGWTLIAVIALGASIKEGLAGSPEMQIVGNGSAGTSLRWFADRTSSMLPVATAWSVPMLVYRGAMLAWSLWLAVAFLGWIRFGFRAFGSGGYWRDLIKPRAPSSSAASAASAAAVLVVPEAPAGAPTSAAAVSSVSLATSSSSVSTESASAPDSSSLPE